MNKPHSKNKIEAKWATGEGGGGAANLEPGVYSINKFHESHAFPCYFPCCPWLTCFPDIVESKYHALISVNYENHV